MACDKYLTNTLNLSLCLKASKTILFIFKTFILSLDGLGITPIRESESDFYLKKKRVNFINTTYTTFIYKKFV